MNNLNISLYKFGKKKYTELAVKKGQIRLGTFFDFRDEEKHRGNILDKKEGIYERITKIDMYSGNIQGINKSLNTKFKGGGLIAMYGVNYSQTMVLPNAFVFCCSSELNESTINAAKIEGYDSVYKINNHLKFSDIIASNLNGKVMLASGGFCVYTDNNTIKTNLKAVCSENLNFNQYFIKRKQFERQKEYRLIFSHLNSKNIEPIIISDIRLTKLMEEIEI